MASKYDTTAIKTFDNEVVAIKLQNQLITQVDMNRFITTDYSLTANPGMTYKVRTYVGSGNVEEVAMGAGNTGDIGADFTETSYEVKTTQGRVKYYDEQQMNDPTAVDKAIAHLATQMTNDITTKVVAELNKATLVKNEFGWNFNDTIDALLMLPDETNEGMFILISRKDLGKFQKNLKDDLKYTEDYIRTGIIGTVAGVPIYPTDACSEGTAYLASKEAVTCFMKKGVEVEQDRDIDKRSNMIVGRNVKVVALTNAKKVVKLTSAKASTT